MFRKIYPLFIALTALVFTMPVSSYDVDSANAYAELFADAKGATTGKNLHLFPAEKFVGDIKTQKSMVVLDVRTPKETAMVSITLPGTLNVPLNELFSPESISMLPQDKTIVVFCHSGLRSTAAATALRPIGFEIAYVVKGGLKALINYLGPKQAYAAVKAASK